MQLSRASSAALGAAAYFFVFSLATLAAFDIGLPADYCLDRCGMFSPPLAPIPSAFVIRHFCQFCLLSALVTVPDRSMAFGLTKTFSERDPDKPVYCPLPCAILLTGAL